MASMQDIPAHILERILLYASDDLKQWTSVFPAVCQQWENIVPLLWSEVDVLKYTPENFIVYLVKLDLLLSLNVPKNDVSIARGFDYIVRRCPKRLELNLDNCWLINETFNPLCKVLDSDLFSNLQHLTLYLLGNFQLSLMNRFSDAVRNLKSLQEINISFCMLEENSKIVVNSITANETAMFHYLVKSVLANCKMLKKIVIVSNAMYLVDVESLRDLQDLQRLEIFEFTTGVWIDADYFCRLFNILAKCSNTLQNVLLCFPAALSLNIEDCQNSMLRLARKKIRKLSLGISGTPIPGIEYVNGMPPLEEFKHLFALLADFKHLQQLALREVDLSDNVYPTVLQRLPLVKLELFRVRNLDDKFFDTFAMGIKNLEQFIVGVLIDDKKPTPESLVEFLAKCQRLEKFRCFADLMNDTVAPFSRLMCRKIHLCGSFSSKAHFFGSSIEIKVKGIAEIGSVLENLNKENLCGLTVVQENELAGEVLLRLFRRCH